MKFLFSITLFSLLAPASGQHNDNWGWAQLETRLPKALSDHSASFWPEYGMVYIAGGCDAKDGNVYSPGDGGGFYCGSISNSFYAWTPEDPEFITLANLPRARYRHSSVFIKNQLWLVGGRTLEDVLIPEVDVYDIDSREWTTYTLPDQYQVSDHASFSHESSYVYIAGGYDQNYTALSMVSRIAVSATADDGTLSIEEVAPLNTARGDIYGATAQNGNSAFVSGGFTHENDFCDPLASTEEYNFENDDWKVLPDLVNARGEIVLVELDNNLYSLGGERQIEGICDLTGDTDPGELTVGTDLVEVFEKNINDWKVVSGFPDHKFRFAAVGVGGPGEPGLIYAFGGQTAFDDDCQCFKTTDDVSVFGEGVSSGTIMSLSVLCSVVSVLSIGLIMM